jgi:hypothetical protein
MGIAPDFVEIGRSPGVVRFHTIRWVTGATLIHVGCRRAGRTLPNGKVGAFSDDWVRDPEAHEGVPE